MRQLKKEEQERPKEAEPVLAGFIRLGELALVGEPERSEMEERIDAGNRLIRSFIYGDRPPR